jgi:hypothetical protein
MKIKSLISLFVLVNGMLIGTMVYGDDPLKTTGTDAVGSGPSDGMGWQEQTRRTPVLVSDGIRITTGPAVGTSGFSWSVGFSSNFNIVDCCKPCSDKHSWCNFNADDPRCDN